MVLGGGWCWARSIGVMLSLMGNWRVAGKSVGLRPNIMHTPRGSWYYKASGAHPIIGPSVSVASDLQRSPCVLTMQLA